MKELACSILTGLVMFAIAWGTFTTRVSQLEATASTLEQRQTEFEKQRVLTREQLASMATNIEWIKKKLSKE